MIISRKIERQCTPSIQKVSASYLTQTSKKDQKRGMALVLTQRVIWLIFSGVMLASSQLWSTMPAASHGQSLIVQTKWQSFAAWLVIFIDFPCVAKKIEGIKLWLNYPFPHQRSRHDVMMSLSLWRTTRRSAPWLFWWWQRPPWRPPPAWDHRRYRMELGNGHREDATPSAGWTPVALRDKLQETLTFRIYI